MPSTPKKSFAFSRKCLAAIAALSQWPVRPWSKLTGEQSKKIKRKRKKKEKNRLSSVLRI
jgi:hypothetical protein